MKKFIKLFCIVSCMMVCFVGCGKKNDVSYNAEDIRAFLNVQVDSIAKGEKESVDEDNTTFRTEEGVYTAAVESWNELAESCGKSTETVSDFTITEQNGELAVTEVIWFENRKVNISSTLKQSDEKYTMTSLSFDPIYTMKEKLITAGMNTAVGMGTVFCVLIFISAVISLFGFIPQITEFFSNRKKKEEDAKVVATEEKNTVVAQPTVTEDTELIAVIAAAIAASENTTTDAFVVRSIRKR